MKKTLIYALILTLGFSACKKTEVDNLFYATPEQRIADTLNFIRNELTTAPYGWKGGFTTGLKGGFGFYFQFDNEQVVKMVSDFDNASAANSKGSSYRVFAGSLPSLLFDTYNYISLMQDPVPGTAGGSAGEGYRSDIEFTYRGHRGDSLFFAGKKYQYPLTLVKATENEKQAYLADGITACRNNFLVVNTLDYQFSFLSGNADGKLAIEVDYDGKILKFTYVNNAGEVTGSKTAPFFYTSSDLSLVRTFYVPYDGKWIKALRVDGNTILAVFTDGSTRLLGTQTSPLYNFPSVFDYNKTFKKLVWSGTQIPGITANVHIFNTVNSAFVASGRTISNMYFGFNNSTTAKFYIAYSATSNGVTTNYTASATYEYRREGNKIWFKRTAIDNNFNTRATQVAAVNNFFGTGDEREFVLDWVSSSNPTVKYPIGAIKSATNLNNMLHGKIGE